MLKLMGLLLLFSSCALLGARKAAQLGERTCAVGRMIDFWRQFALQLECLRCPPCQIVHLLTAQQEFVADPFFTALDSAFDGGGSFGLALKKALKTSPQLAKWGVSQAICPLGDVIGIRELETQLAALASAVLTLERLESTAAQEQGQKGSLYKKLGVLAGVLGVVILF